MPCASVAAGSLSIGRGRNSIMAGQLARSPGRAPRTCRNPLAVRHRRYAARAAALMADFIDDDGTDGSEPAGMEGLVAGRYRVRARLGRGATKEVYLAYDERLDRDVALAIVVGAL